MILISLASLSANSCLPPFVNCSTESRRCLISEFRTCISSLSSSAPRFSTCRFFRAALTMRSADSRCSSRARIALGIILAVAVIGAFIALAGGLRRFAGFQDIAADAERIAKALGGELFRDGGDLVASGNLGGKLPTVVRFSNKENVPGLNIRMG